MQRSLLTSTAILALLSAPVSAQDVIELDEIVFTATAVPLRFDRIGSSVAVLEEDEIDPVEEPQLVDTLARLPGVSLQEAGPPGTASQLIVRGAGAEFLSVFVDGILVTDPSATEAPFDNFGGLTTGTLRRVELLRGSQSSLYGGTAVAGVLNVSTLADDTAPERLAQEIEVSAGSHNTYSLDYALSYRMDDTILSFGLSHIQSDGFSAGDENNNNPEADRYDQTRITGGFEHALTPSFRVGANGFYEDSFNEFDEFGTAPIDGTPGDEEQERRAYGLRIFAEGDVGRVTHFGALSYYRVERDSESLTVSPETLAAFGLPFENAFTGERARLEYRYSFEASDALLLSGGIDFRDETATGDTQLGGSNSVQTFGVYQEATISPSDRFDVTVTARNDRHSLFGNELTGRIAAAYRPVDALVLRGAVGTGFRPPSLDELFGDFPSSFFTGNPDLDPETSVSYEVGFDYFAPGGAQFSATAFLLEIDNLITFDFQIPTSTLINVEGVSERFGVELSGSVPLGDRATLTGAYTFTQALDADGDRLANIPRHDAVIGVDADITQKVNLAATAQFVGDRANGFFDPEPYTDYTLFDAAVGYEFVPGYEAFLRVENILDEEYQRLSGFGTPDRTFHVGLRASF